MQRWCNNTGSDVAGCCLGKHSAQPLFDDRRGQATPVAQAGLHSEAGLGARDAVPSHRTGMEPAAFVTDGGCRCFSGLLVWCPNRWDLGPLESPRRCEIWCFNGLVSPGFNLSRSRPTCCSSNTPTDIYLPALAGLLAAVDFAVTAPQRQETLAQIAREMGAAAAAYAKHKDLHPDIARNWESQAVTIVLMDQDHWDPLGLGTKAWR